MPAPGLQAFRTTPTLISSVCVDVNLLYNPNLCGCLPSKPNFLQPTSASKLILVPKVLQDQALQSVSWLCCISRHFVRSAADISLLSTCNPVVHASPQVSVAASQKKKETTSNNVILWPLLLFSNSAGLWELEAAREETLSSTSSREQRFGVTTRNYWEVSGVLHTSRKSCLFSRKYLILATHTILLTVLRSRNLIVPRKVFVEKIGANLSLSQGRQDDRTWNWSRLKLLHTAIGGSVRLEDIFLPLVPPT